MARQRHFRAGLALLAALLLLPHGCGSKSGLPVALNQSPTGLFCATADYASGAKELGIYIVLDRSESMANDGKWTQATAALGAFVSDPSMAGVAVALGYYPLGSKCAPSSYVAPAVFAKDLPADAELVLDSLAAQKPSGETPTRPALYGAIEFSRALMLAEPTRRVVVAVVSDGAPLSCESTPASVAEVAGDGATGTPQVLTFAIGLRSGAVGDLDLLAEKGGTGQPVLVSDGPGAGQELVDALRALREGQLDCRFAVPPVAGATTKPEDVRVAYRLDATSGLTSAPRVADGADCGATPYGFFLHGAAPPTHAALCPALCNLLRGFPDSRATVVAGCGDGLDASAPPPPPPDAGDCGGIITFACVTACGTEDYVPPICAGAFWQCPPGSVSSNQCGSCAPVPHVCCLPDATLADAQCIDGTWLCPPGGSLYGTGSCKAPGVCAATLPCAVGQYCESPNFSCGKGTLAGHCVPEPASCAAGGPAVCGCDGTTHPNACDARKQGVDLSKDLSCQKPIGTFDCGPLFCNVSAELCKKTTVFGGSVPLEDYACIPAPPGCATGCGCKLCAACPPGKLCNETCSKDASGGRTLSCNQ